MKTLITLVIPVALLAASSVFAQNSTGHEYSRTGNYFQEPVKYQVPAKRIERRENASNRSASQTNRYGAGHDYSRTNDYRNPKVVQQSGQRDGRSASNGLRDEQPKVIAPAFAPNRFGTTNP